MGSLARIDSSDLIGEIFSWQMDDWYWRLSWLVRQSVERERTQIDQRLRIVTILEAAAAAKEKWRMSRGLFMTKILSRSRASYDFF
jgi:hypothetical protein